MEKFCDNASRRGRVSVTPQCYDGPREFDVTVIYNPGKYGRDSMVLCKECLKILRREGRRRGYRVAVKPHVA